jgi:hypothetical protein
MSKRRSKLSEAGRLVAEKNGWGNKAEDKAEIQKRFVVQVFHQSE